MNFLKDNLNKLKVNNLPKLNFSFNEGLATLQSKNFITVLGLIDKATKESVKGTVPPELENKVSNLIMNNIMKVVDWSGATDLEGIDSNNVKEINTSNKIITENVQTIDDWSGATKGLEGVIKDKSGKIINEELNLLEYDKLQNIDSPEDWSGATDLEGKTFDKYNRISKEENKINKFQNPEKLQSTSVKSSATSKKIIIDGYPSSK